MRRLMMGVLALALLVPAAAWAQPDVRRRGPAGARGFDMPNLARVLTANRQALELTDEQVARLDDLARQSDERREQVRTLRGQMSDTALSAEERTRLRESMRTAMADQRETHQGIRSVLTVEQSDRAARLGAALGSIGGRGGAVRGARGDRIGRPMRFDGPQRQRAGRAPRFQRRPPGPRATPDIPQSPAR